MAGHSKWSQIKRQKAVTDSKRGAMFTKLGNQIAISARNGTDPDLNPGLAMAIEKAKAANMPLSNIERSIQRVKDKSVADLQEVLYEGYGPGGTAIIVEAATDNVNRTLPAVRTAFTKHGGSMGEKGSVAYQFERKGMIRVKGTGDDITLKALDAGADDLIETPGDSADQAESIIYTEPTLLAKVRDSLKQQGIKILEAELTYEPKNVLMLEDQHTIGKVMRLMEALEDLEDVTNTYTNFDIANGVAA